MRHLACILMLAGVSVWVGCAHKPAVEGLVKVTGTVTYQGKPVEGATVVFSPEGKGRPASGRTDSSGRFQLTTLEANDGAMPGKYRVAISKFEGASSAATPPSADEMAKKFTQMRGRAAVKGGAAKLGGAKNLLPVKYRSPKTSGLTAEVPKDGKDFSFSLD
jgi:Carboxypeptidase regulatory-like domain